MRFKHLAPFAALMFAAGTAGIFVPSLVSLVVALAAVFLAGVVVITGDYVAGELRKDKGTPGP